MKQLWISLSLCLSMIACKKSEPKSENTADKTQAKKTDPAAKTPGHEKGGAASHPGKAATPATPAPPDVAAAPADAQKTEAGVFYKVLTPGKADGKKPKAWDKVEVHYTGWTTDGKMFDTSSKRGKPASFGLNEVIPGWRDGLQTMQEGGKSRFWIPEEMAYKGRPGRPAGMLVFDVELLSVTVMPEPPPVPADVASPPKTAKKTAKGVSFVVLQKGTGKAKPKADDRVTVNYTGWTTDGKMFDSSVTRGKPASFALNAVIPGWTDGLTTMVKGQKNRFWIPEEMAYKGQPDKPQGMLVFEVELVEIMVTPPAPAVPKDVAAPPKDAKKTEKGVFYKVLKKGTGKEHPAPINTVKVHYTGWTTDGKQFDSSVTRGQPASFPLDNVIAGWTDGVPTMVVGEKTRFWIPEDLAYKGKSGPQGMLVFDIELLEIQK